MPIDLTGIGGWLGAQDSLRDYIAQTAARGAQERAQIEAMAQLGLKGRAQDVSERNQALAEQTYAEAAPIRQANLAHLGATTGLVGAQTDDLRSQPMRDLTRQTQDQSNKVALAILGDQLTGNRTKNNQLFQTSERLGGEAFQGGQNALDRGVRREGFNVDRSTPSVVQLGDGSFGLVNKQTGVMSPTTSSGGGARPLGKATTSQENDFGYYVMAKRSGDDMNALQSQLQPKDLALIQSGEAFFRNPLGEMAVNTALSPIGQQFANAARNWTESTARQSSGKAIKDSEYARIARIFIDTVGDTPESTAQKRQFRADKENSLALGSGPLYERANGKPFDASVLQNKTTPTGPRSPNLVYDPATNTFRPPGGG